MSHDIRLTWQVPQGQVTEGLQGVSPESGPSTQAFGQLAKEVQYGQSVIIARTGETLARAKNDLGNEILYADLPIPESAGAHQETPPMSE